MSTLFKRTEEQRANISNSKKGKPLSNEHKAALSKGSARFWAGKTIPKETIDKMRKTISGRRLSEIHKKKLSESHKGISAKNKIAIIQTSMDGIFIKEYPSVTEAAISVGIGKTAIQNNLSGRSLKTAGFKFKYKEVISDC